MAERNHRVRFLAPRSEAPHIRRQLLTAAGPSRRAFLTGVGLAGLAGLSACGQTGRMASSPPADGEIEAKLNLYSWGDYDDPEIISEFSDTAGVRVQVDSYGSNDELMAKLAGTRGTSGYDIVVPTGSRVQQMIEHDLIQPLDLERIPNFRNMDPNFIHQEFDPENRYSICKAWGTTGYVYDRTVIDRELTSWQDFIDAAGTDASGSTAILEDPWELTAIALASMGEDVNTVDEAILEKAKAIVVDDIAPHVRAYMGNAAQGMTQGGLSLLHAFNGDARQGLLESDDPDRWQFVFPTPVANLWMDNWCLATGAPHPDAAYAFINHMISPDAALRNVDYIGYHVGTQGLKEEAADFDFPDIIFPDQEILDRLVPSEEGAGIQPRVEIYTAAQTRSSA